MADCSDLPLPITWVNVRKQRLLAEMSLCFTSTRRKANPLPWTASQWLCQDGRRLGPAKVKNNTFGQFERLKANVVTKVRHLFGSDRRQEDSEGRKTAPSACGRGGRRRGGAACCPFGERDRKSALAFQHLCLPPQPHYP